MERQNNLWCNRIQYMDLIPLAFDSMGVRSMCCFITTEPGILIDPGVSLAPRRFGLPPHEIELETLREKRSIIQKYAHKAGIITVSHWHNDHHTPFITGLYNTVTPDLAEELYKDKIILGKAVSGLNYMQKKRAQSFEDHCSFTPADTKTFHYGDTTITFSHPVPHGTQTTVPVIMVSVKNDITIVHASDIQGINGLKFIKQETPDILVMSGPPVNLFTAKDINTAKSTILQMLPYCNQLILDHHHVRDTTFKETLPEIWKNPKVMTASEFINQPNKLLEANRKKLYNSSSII
jgi:predicted metallo-beta-lactamase superfamily hydrolase